MLTTFDLDEYVYAALKAGASGFLLKDTPPNDLLAGIRAVAEATPCSHPAITQQLIREYVSRPDSPALHPPNLDGLTERELEVLILVAKGWSNVEVAERLVHHPSDRKPHISRLLMKLGARDRAQLIVMAYEVGLVSPSSRSKAGYGEVLVPESEAGRCRDDE